MFKASIEEVQLRSISANLHRYHLQYQMEEIIRCHLKNVTMIFVLEEKMFRQFLILHFAAKKNPVNRY